MRAYIARELEYRGQVDLEYGFPVVVWKLVCRVAPLNSAAVEQDVYPVAVFEDSGEQRGDRGFGSEICGVDCSFATERFNCLLGGLVRSVALGLRVSVSVSFEFVGIERAYLDKKNVCSCFCECNGHGLTDSSRSACYQGGLALEREELVDGRHGGSGSLLRDGDSEGFGGEMEPNNVDINS